MEYNLRDDAMRLVIRYLNGEDLKNACLACRSWTELIFEQISIRDPKIFRQEVIINRYNRAVAKDELVFFSTDMRPFILICFTNKNCNSDVVKRYICQLRPMHCILAQLKRNIFEDVNTVWTILIPSSFHLYIDILNFVTRSNQPVPESSFLNISMDKGVHFFVETHIGLDKFCSETYIYRGQSIPNFFTILFCTYSQIPALKNIIAQFSSWYPYTGPIWGCTLESVQALCKTYYKKKLLQEFDIVHIFITADEFLTKLLIFDDYYNTKEKIQNEFQDLKRKINLKRYSIAFMCTSVARYKDFYPIESTAFQEIFPGVPLAHIFSRRPFGATNFSEFNKYLIDIEPHVGNNVTTFLLFTYNQ